jgi:hypothetical protein
MLVLAGRVGIVFRVSLPALKDLSVLWCCPLVVEHATFGRRAFAAPTEFYG